MRDIDLTRLYIGDYVADTMDLAADQHDALQQLLLQIWLQQPAKLKIRWLRKRSGLSRSEWRVIQPSLLEPLEIALAGVHRWNKAIKAYDGQRLPPFEWQILRTIVLARDDYTCQYCGGTEDLHADHRTAVARGGSNALDNLVTACGPCNHSKGSKPVDSWLESRAKASG
jgi:HNH endonuclease